MLIASEEDTVFSSYDSRLVFLQERNCHHSLALLILLNDSCVSRLMHYYNVFTN